MAINLTPEAKRQLLRELLFDFIEANAMYVNDEYWAATNLLQVLQPPAPQFEAYNAAHPTHGLPLDPRANAPQFPREVVETDGYTATKKIVIK